MKIVNLFVAAISCLIVGASPSYAIKQCVNSLYDDNIVSFGFSVALNERYLAVGDPGANHVVIYTRNNSGKWIRSKELSPPKDSVFSKIGNGFGRGLQLDENVLVINAFSIELISGTTDHKTFYGRYLIRLDSETEVRTIDLLVEKTQGLVQLNLLSEGEIQQMTLPDNQEIEFKESFGFGSDVAFDNNLLLVGFAPYPKKGGAWLFNLNQPKSKPLKITAPDASIGSSVALNKRFAAVGNALFRWDIDTELPFKTLIRAIDSGSTTVIDSYGELSLSGNILAIMRFGSANYEITALLKVFRLDDNAKPELIIERGHPVERAWVQNGFLVTVARHRDINVRPIGHIKVCLEPVH